MTDGILSSQLNLRCLWQFEWGALCHFPSWKDTRNDSKGQRSLMFLTSPGLLGSEVVVLSHLTELVHPMSCFPTSPTHSRPFIWWLVQEVQGHFYKIYRHPLGPPLWWCENSFILWPCQRTGAYCVTQGAEHTQGARAHFSNDPSRWQPHKRIWVGESELDVNPQCPGGCTNQVGWQVALG